MPRAQVPFYALNAGEVDPDALARIDLEKLRLAGEQMVNWTPTVLGGMHMRPGTKYLGGTKSNEKVRLIPFVFNATTTSLIEVSASAIRVRNNDALVTFPTYSTSIGNPSFDLAIGSGWNNVSTVGAEASTNGSLLLFSGKYSYAIARQVVSVSSGDAGTLHTLKVEVGRGPVNFRVGTGATGGSDIVSNQTLDTGTHFISFTPSTTTISVEIEANAAHRGVRFVNEVDFVKNTILELPSPWSESDLPNIRYAQSGSVIYLACKGYPQYKIERRGQNSWGLSDYLTSSGPYIPSSGSNIRMKLTGNAAIVDLISDRPYFKPSMAGAVFELTYPRQAHEQIFTGPDQVTEPVKVVGVGEKGRLVGYSAFYPAGTSGTVELQRAFGSPDGWSSEMRGNGPTSISTSTAVGFTDSDSDVSSEPTFTEFDNVIVYYRLRARSNLVGPVSVGISHKNGASQSGVVRVLQYTSETSVVAEILSPTASENDFTDDWREGAWSYYQSWPSAVSFYDGRLWWGGLDKVYGSVSDDFQNFDPNTQGDSGPIVRSIATGPVENIGWLLPLQRLIVGTASAEVSIRSSSFDEPLTPAKFTARNASTMGSAAIQAAVVDSSGMFVQKNRSKVYEFLYDVNINDYSSRDLTRLNKNVCRPGVVDLAVQRQPDTRVWFVKSDGTMAMLVYERSDEVVGWSRFEMDGFIEAVCVLPSENDDNVYIAVRRTINGQTVRYIEKLTVSSETEDGDGSWLVDSSVRFTTGGAATKTISGLQHLVGKQVVAKGASSDPMKRFTVTAGGQIFIDNFVTSLVVGLPYEARFESVKLAYGSASGTALTQKKRVDHLSIVANNTAPEGISIGRNFTSMTKLSSLMHGKPLTAGQIVDQYDYDATSFGGAWDSDSRVCIKCQSPYPAHILGMVITMNNNDKVYQWPKKPQQSGGDEEA
jgi:hypothetical protein